MVTSEIRRLTSSERRCAPANPTNNSAASRCAAIAVGHTVIDGRITSNNSRTSARSSRLRRFGGVFRSRRIPDRARRTTSDRPSASKPAAVWTWLIDEAHRVSDAAPYAGRPSGLRSSAASVRYAATNSGDAGNTTCPPANPHRSNRPQSDRYAAFVAADVDPSTAAHTRRTASASRSGAPTGGP